MTDIINEINDNTIYVFIGIIFSTIAILSIFGKVFRNILFNHLSKYLIDTKNGIIKLQKIDKSEVYKIVYNTDLIELLPNKQVDISISLYTIVILCIKSLTRYDFIINQSPSKSDVHCHCCSTCKTLPDIYVTSRGDKKVIKHTIRF